MKVAILGASAKPERMAHLAQQRLVEYGHDVIPVSPVYPEVLGLKTVSSLSKINQPIDTLTVYVSPDKAIKLIDEITQLKPSRVILNPGSESYELIAALKQSEINVMEACTLVMLSASSF
jgi:predicted CoA-binding protein